MTIFVRPVGERENVPMEHGSNQMVQVEGMRVGDSSYIRARIADGTLELVDNPPDKIRDEDEEMQPPAPEPETRSRYTRRTNAHTPSTSESVLPELKD